MQSHQYFVVGGSENSDIGFDNPMVGYIAEKGPQKTIDSFFSVSGKVVDAIDDGRIYSNAIILLKCNRNSKEQNEKLDSMKLAYRDSNRRPQARKEPIP